MKNSERASGDKNDEVMLTVTHDGADDVRQE